MNSDPLIYNKMQEQELIKLIEFAPTNMREFFDKSMKI